MAVAMIKPQLAIPVAGWLFLWSISDWRKRSTWLLGFGLTMALLLAASEWLFPGWILRFRDTALAYRVYAARGGVLDTLFSPVGGKLLTVVLVLVVVFLCWKSRTFPEGAVEFQHATALVLATSVVILPMIVPYNHVLLLPSVLLLAREWTTLSRRTLLTRALSIAALVLVAWPWLATTALIFLSATMPPEQVQKGWAVPLFSSLFIPAAVLALQLVSIATQKTDRPESA